MKPRKKSLRFTKCMSALILAAALMVSLAPSLTAVPDKAFAADSIESAATSPMREITTMELVKEMGIGINLGNTFESTGDWINNASVSNYETAWGSPIITEDMIKGYASEGFGVLRIPVSWSNMMGEDYTINPDYLARVKEVVDWALGSGMYVILNLHWDGGWFERFPSEKEESMYKYTRIWTQLTDAFRDYDDHLMFESFNEEGVWLDLWNFYSGQDTVVDGRKKAYALLNEINQTFVDIVRGSGGNNEQRHLLIGGYGTDFEKTVDELYKMPNDPQNRMAVSVHYYTPSAFAILDADADWGKADPEWGSEEDFAELNRLMDMVKTRFIDNGIPVIMGEFGVATKNKTQEMIRLYLSSVNKAAYSRGITPVLWDITNVFYNRNTNEMIDKALLEQLMAVKDGDPSETDPPANSTITPTAATFSKRRPADITVTMTLNGNTLLGVKNGTASLVQGTDYTVSGNTVTVSKTYLGNRPIGSTSLTFDFSAGTDPLLTVKIKR